MNGREIVVGVTGGIAAYKTAALVSQLVQAGAGVSVVMTGAAERFVGVATFAALTGRRVARDIFDETHFPLGAHIGLAEKAELLVVAPASADFLARAAHGAADDLLTTLYLAFSGKVLVAPAMNTAMWEKAAVQRNIAQLRADGVHFVDPTSGWLSCRQTGKGRMAEPDAILTAIRELLESAGKGNNRS
jgi:phosphopantothenoylcysteine decarboxylase/phosphopantothenate--cysteine ligase